MVSQNKEVRRKPVHGPTEELQEAVDALDSERTLLVNVNEHLLQAHTNELQSVAVDSGVELARDFQTIEL